MNYPLGTADEILLNSPSLYPRLVFDIVEEHRQGLRTHDNFPSISCDISVPARSRRQHMRNGCWTRHLQEEDDGAENAPLQHLPACVTAIAL
jgi:hypothetical protein